MSAGGICRLERGPSARSYSTVADQPSASARGHLEVSQDGGRHWLRLVDEDGEELLTGGPVSSLTEVLGTIAQLRDGSAAWQARMTASGEYYFCVLDDQGELLGTSPMYVAPADRDRGLAAARAIVPAASLVVHGMGRHG